MTTQPTKVGSSVPDFLGKTMIDKKSIIQFGSSKKMRLSKTSPQLHFDEPNETKSEWSS